MYIDPPETSACVFLKLIFFMVRFSALYAFILPPEYKLRQFSNNASSNSIYLLFSKNI